MKKTNLLQLVKHKHPTFLATIIVCIAMISNVKSNPPQDILEPELHDTLKIDHYYMLAGGYIYKNIDSATYFVNQGFELSKKYQFMDGIAQGYGFLGFLSHQRGNLTEAIRYNIKCLAIIQAQGYESEYPRILNNLATLHLELENYDQAKDYYEECIPLNIAANAKKSLASNYNNLALIYRFLKDYENSYSYYLKALEIRVEIRDSIGLASTYSNMGSLYEVQNQLDSAIFYHIKSLTLRELLKERKGIAISLYKAGYVYFQEKKYKNALQYAEESYKIATKWGYKIQEKEASEVLYKIYKATNNTALALKYHERFNLLADSLNNIEAQKKVIESEYQLEYNKKYLIDSLRNKQILVENELLEKENTLKENSLSIQRLWLFLVIILLFTLIVLLVLFRKNAKAKETQLRTEVKLRLSEVLALQDKLKVKNEQNQSPIEGINIVLDEKLSEREQEVLDALVLGLSNKDIGEKLFLSVNTIKSHINNLYFKLDVNNRTQAAIKGSLLRMSEQN